MNMEGIYETVPAVYRPYPRRLESLKYNAIFLAKKTQQMVYFCCITFEIIFENGSMSKEFYRKVY